MFKKDRNSRSGWQQKQSERRQRIGSSLVNSSNLEQIYLERFSVEKQSGYGALLPQHPADHNKFYMSTTSRENFGEGTKPNIIEQMSKRNPNFSKQAGGVGGKRIERGFATSGATGERLLTDSDPQKNTAAQRSWLYSEDPMFRAAPKSRPDVTHLSLDINSDGQMPQPGPRTGPITQSCDPRRYPAGERVFSDF
jgi:hypothetical protein